jgi:hypothetical protein
MPLSIAPRDGADLLGRYTLVKTLFSSVPTEPTCRPHPIAALPSEGMADVEIRTALRHYLQVLKAQEVGIEPFFGDDATVLTPERLSIVQTGFEELEKAKRAYYDALEDAGWPRPAG